MLTKEQATEIKRLIIIAKEKRGVFINDNGGRASYDAWIKAEQNVENYINTLTEG